MRGLAREHDQIAIVVQIGSVVPGNRDEHRAMAERIVCRPVGGGHDAEVLRLVEYPEATHVDDVGREIGGVHEAVQKARKRPFAKPVPDFHRYQGDVLIDCRKPTAVVADNGRHGRTVSMEVADGEAARVTLGDDRVVFRYERRRPVEIDEPLEVRECVVDAGVEDRDFHVAGAEVAGRPSLVGEHRPHIPLTRIELGCRRRRRGVRGRDRLAGGELGGGAGSFATAKLEGHHMIGLHGLNVRCGRQLGRCGFRQAGHRRHANAVERGLDGAAQRRDARLKIGGDALGREHHDMAAGLLLRQFGLHGKLGTIGRDGPRLV